MIGRTVGTYRIVEKLGEGAMGAVYRAVDTMVERNVAIKVLKPEIAQNAETLERFRREAVALARLNHPSIAQLYAFFREGDEYFMAMEFVSGETLAARLEREGRLPWQEALRILAPALEAVEHAHGMGILHRDLKPANIMLAADGRVKVMDFGIAYVLNTARMTREARLVGTLEYLAPERALGAPPDARSDIYSLGMVLYEMLTGRLPFSGETDFELIRAQLNQKPPRPDELGLALPPPIEELLMTALQKDPARRFPSAAAFLAEAQKAARTVEGTAAPPAAVQGVPVRWRWLIAGGVVVAVAAGGFSGFEIWRAVYERAQRRAAVANVAPAPQPSPQWALGPTVTIASIPTPTPTPTPAPELPSVTLAAPPAARPAASAAARPAPAPNLARVQAALAGDPSAPLHYAPVYNAMRLGGAPGVPVIRQAIEQRGVDFRPTPGQVRELRAAGATDALLQSIRNGYREIPPPARVAAATPPPAAPRPPEPAPVAAVEKPSPTRRRIEVLENVETVFIQPMPDGFDRDLREAIAKELGGRLRLVAHDEADAYLEVSVGEEKSRAVLGATQRWLGLKGGQKAYVRIAEARGGRILWEAEAGDRSVLSGHLGDNGRRIAARLAKRLKHDLHE
jgi:serine/threonine-protein kinase